MLRLYLDAHHGISGPRCPNCGQHLLPGAERMGRWVVAYDGRFRARPGSTVWLVCPGYECPYLEPAMIARTAVDAVPYSPAHAAERWKFGHSVWTSSLDELEHELVRLRALYRQNGHPKLLSAIRWFRIQYSSTRAELSDQVEMACEEGYEVKWLGREGGERGRILALMNDRVLFEPTGSGRAVLLPMSDLRDLIYCDEEYLPPHRYDLGGRTDLPEDVHPVYMPSRFVVIDGHRLVLDSVTRFQVCRVETGDEQVARALNLWKTPRGPFAGEFPVGVVQRSYHLIRHAHVQGHRLFVEADTNYEDVFYLSTRHLDVARALNMVSRRRHRFRSTGVRWSGFFYRDEISRFEELEATARRPRYRRRRLLRFVRVIG
ncbi:MAG TPA: hypothetical protein VD902_22885 [Symbiobacteriaceae bacterium]|nr:hypothetical protein [Symbiobacteriaceae bacterium]